MDQIKTSREYWDQRWKDGQTGWDMGFASPPIRAYMDQYSNKMARILIPGCGQAHEADYLLAHGFGQITLVDISMEATAILNTRYRGKSGIRILQEDFFEHQGDYDLILEQTFFCALPRGLRTSYAEKMNQLLAEGGKLVGLLFDRDFEGDHPPFGGSADEYKAIFAPWFTMNILAPCYNSIPSRFGTELFIQFQKKA